MKCIQSRSVLVHILNRAVKDSEGVWTSPLQKGSEGVEGSYQFVSVKTRWRVSIRIIEVRIARVYRSALNCTHLDTMSKKKGVSLEDKRERILDVIQKSNTCWLLKVRVFLAVWFHRLLVHYYHLDWIGNPAGCFHQGHSSWVVCQGGDSRQVETKHLNSNLDIHNKYTPNIFKKL